MPIPESMSIPATMELTVLKADAPSDRTIGFVVYERQGCSLYPIIDGKIGEEPVPATEDLVVGRDYTASGLMGEDLLWKVMVNSSGELSITCGPSLIGILERGGDDRNCWRVTGMINTRGLKKMALTRD
jgi:hypothetical protein